MYNCKGTSTPMKYIIFFDSSCDDHLVDGSLCRRNIGKLYYFSFMRSYITFAITILFQAMHQHLCLIVLLLQDLLRYLHLTTSICVLIANEIDRRQLAYFDSNWLKDPPDRTLITFSVIYLGSFPISWSLRKQSSVSCSSIDVEYRSVAATISETHWLTYILQEHQFPLIIVPRVLCDNISTTYICADPIFLSRMNHVDMTSLAA